MLPAVEAAMNRQQIDTDRAVARHAVILCHPDGRSFNRAIADTYCAAVMSHGQEAVLRDLYAMDFDPVLKREERATLADFELKADVAQELAILRNCDVLVLGCLTPL
jgi:NAD(P)H dehydrogenase (quinone)